MAKNELISIIVPVYNRKKLIKQTLDSILAQTYPYWECLVIDDGSIDGTMECLKEYAAKDNRIRIYERHRQPKGANTCRNMGIEVARGDWLLFLDSDDLISNNAIKNRLHFIEKHKSKDIIVFPELQFTNSPTSENHVQHKLISETPDLIRFFQLDQPFLTPGPLWKKSSLKRIGGFSEYLNSFQDWELNVRALLLDLKYTKIDLIPIDIFHRWEPKGTSITNSETGGRLASTIRHTLISFTELEQFWKFIGQKPENRFHVIAFYLKSAIKIVNFGERVKATEIWKLILEHKIISYGEWWYWHLHLQLLHRCGRSSPIARLLPFIANRVLPFMNYPK